MVVATRVLDPAVVAEIAHLLRRAGFGGRPEALRDGAAKGYEAVVDDLLDLSPDDPRRTELVDRYFPASTASHEWAMSWPHWAWPVLSSPHPLREKMALFWHGLFATGFKQGLTGIDQIAQIEMFRRYGMGRFEDLLQHLAQDPAMMVWLDNPSNVAGAPNENFGRELLELFSMGPGNYTEDDVRAAARAFTGWTVRPAPSAFVLGPHQMQTWFRSEQHDNGPKTFLGVEGALDGTDIVRIIARHPATARFICRRLYLYFVDDEADDSAIEALSATFAASDGDIRTVLRTLFLSATFRSQRVRQVRVKSPIEYVFGLARLVEDWELPDHRMLELVEVCSLIGQTPLNPPNVGGWPSGAAWLHGSSLLERVNFASELVGRSSSPSVQRLVASIEAESDGSTESLLDAALLALGGIELSPSSRQVVLTHANTEAFVSGRGHEVTHTLLQLIVASPEFQYG